MLAVLGFVTSVGGAVLWGTAWGFFGYVPLAVFAALAPDRPPAQHAVGGPRRPPRRRLDMGSMTWEEEERWRRRFGVQPDGSNAAGWDAGWGALDAGGGWDGGVDWPPPTGEPYRGLPPPDLGGVSPAGFFRGLDEVFGSITSTSPPPADPDAEDYSYDPRLDEPFSLLEEAHEDDDADWARRLRQDLERMPELGTETPGAGEGAGEAEDQGGTCGGGSPAPAPGTWGAHAMGACQAAGVECFWCDVDNERLAHTADMPAVAKQQLVDDWADRLCREVEGWHNEPWAIG